MTFFSSFIFWSSISTRIPCFVVKLQPLCSHFWLFWKCGCNFQVISCGLERYALHKQTTNNGKTLYYCLLPIKKDKEGQNFCFCYRLRTNSNNQLPYIGVVYRYIYLGEGKYHGWSYVGETVNEKDRKRNWKKDDDKYANHELTEAKRTLDKNKWKYRQLDIVDDLYNLNDVKSKLFELEEDYIKRYNTREEGFNKSSAGTGNKDNSPSEETRKKIGEKSKGRIHTEETKKKISESNLGRHHTDIAKQKPVLETVVNKELKL